MESCEGCGFVYDLDRAEDAGAAVRAAAAELAEVMGRAERPAVRREPDTWSPLEYAGHVRDVLVVQRERVLRARREDTPVITPMGRDERVEHDGYADQDPDAVARQLADAAQMFANVLSRLGARDWQREVAYNYPLLTERSLRWVAVHTVHEVAHHLGDVRRQVDDEGGTRP